MEPAQAPRDELLRHAALSRLVGDTDADVQELLRNRRPNESLGRLVRRLDLAEDVVAAAALADVMRLPLVDASAFDGVMPILSELNPSFLQRFDAALLPAQGDDYIVAVADPAIEDIVAGLSVAIRKVVKPVVAPLALIEKAKSKSSDGGAHRTSDRVADGEADSDERVEDSSAAPVVRLVEELVTGAARARASDMHLEAYPDRLRVRLRIDGVLHDWRTLSSRLSKVVISRIKIMASLDIAERRLPQDGRARMDVDGARFDLRVATLPASHGEGVVIRFLRDSFSDISLESVGMDGDDLARVRRALSAPFGLILVVGPTGAGKSTTLAGALAERNKPGVKIISVEDPVEYQIDGVTQIAVKPSIGLSFASALRAILRSDPDVIVVGELRDAETAEMATNAALTGHLVLATLHANDVAGAVPRLLDLGVDASLIRSTFRLAIAQRLIRRLCEICKRRTDAGFEAAGCLKCEQTGFSGRTGVFELLEIADAHSALIKPGCSSSDFARFSEVNGASGLRASGMSKVARGITSASEVQRVLGL